MAWTINQLRSAVDFSTSNQDDLESASSFLTPLLDTVVFIDSYKRVGHLSPKYSFFLQSLRKDPSLVAQCLIELPKNAYDLSKIVQIIISSLFGDCLVYEDRQLALRFLKEVIDRQLAVNDNPRRLLRHGTCAFSKVYQLFLGNLSESRLFLVSALKDPIISVLAEDDLYLDIEVERAVVRFPPDERLRHFGREGSPDYSERLEKYRIWAVGKLSGLVIKFVDGIKNSVFCFPESLCWIVKQLSEALTKSGKLTQREVGAICTDLIFSHFICHAVINPDLSGIVDMHVTNIARFNLMQVAQVLHVLVMAKYEDVDPKMKDLYDKFPDNSLSTLLENLLREGSSASFSSQSRDVTRTSLLISEPDLHTLAEFAHGVAASSNRDEVKNRLTELLNSIPCPSKATTNNQPAKSSRTNKKENEAIDLSQDRLHVLVFPIDNGSDFTLPGLVAEEKVLEMEQKRRQTKVRMNVENEDNESVISGSVVSEKDGNEKRTRFSQDQESVATSDNLEVISEAMSNHSVDSSLDLENENENDNLSDMVSANVSSGRGTPNVSGRETPSSHSSNDEANGARNDENPPVAVNFAPLQQPALNSIPVEPPGRSNTRNDIEEKFGKFDCKPSAPSLDETKSLLSDTWSTDVLGSDTEALDQVDPTAAGIQAANLNFMNNQALQIQQMLQSGLESVDTASQSDAWSTDVLTSDTERLREFDLDETGSVTRSEDMNIPRSEGDFEENLAASGVRHAFEDDFCSSSQIRQNRVSGDSKSSSIGSKVPDAVSTRGTSGTIPSVSEDGEPFSLEMQTLGRLSFDIRQKNLSCDEAVSCILPLLKEGQEADRRTSLSELLSLDLATTKDQIVEKGKKENELKLNLIDFEMEIATVEGLDLSTLSPDLISNSSQAITVIDEDEKPADDEAKLKRQDQTGAIPKVASFMKGASRSKVSFFKIPNIKSKLTEKMKSFKDRKLPSSSRDNLNQDIAGSASFQNESVDDILEKYRSKVPSNNGTKSETCNSSDEGENSQDAGILDKSAAFDHMKRKIRRVLSRVDVNILPVSNRVGFDDGNNKEMDLLKFLKLLVAETRLKRSCESVALEEAIRCVETLDFKESQQLFWSLREDYHNRATYIAYLMKSKQTLLMTDSHFEVLMEYMTQERSNCSQNLVTIHVRNFLEKKEKALASFVQYFKKMGPPDEKAKLVNKFLGFMYKSLENDPVWGTASPDQISMGRAVIERSVMSQVYVLALFPNGDGDMLRDQILSRHMHDLSQRVTVNHRDLRIPRMYHSESPWPAAQREILTMNAFKTAREKVECVVRTCSIIMNLLSLACERSVPAADDLMPVLVFVLINANPPSLLSTIQYVESFYDKYLEGEDAYWWTQFCSVVEFIKTMD